MAAVSLKDLGTAMVANASAAGVALTLTTANMTALGHMLLAMGDRKGDSFAPIKYLSPTDQNQLIP
jgi:hypothetical protein